MTTTWHPNDLANVTLSGGNLVASTSATGGVRSVNGHITGKYYFEYTVNAWGNSTNTGVGIGNLSAPFATVGTNAANACLVYRSTGNIWFNGSASGLTLGALADGDLLCFAVDLDSKLFWIRRGTAGFWNGSVSGNPATGAVGQNISAIAATGLYALLGFAAGTACQVTANFGASPATFGGVAPSGFTSGFGHMVGEFTPTSWNSNDRVHTTLDSTALIATTDLSTGGVRSIYKAASGKWYFEYTINTWGLSGDTGFGVGTPTANLSSNLGSSGTNCILVEHTGNIYMNGLVGSIGSTPDGVVIGYAIDLDNNLFWARAGAAGNWNNSGTANPATATGGISISTLTGAGINALTTFANTGGTPAQVTANFGSRAFTGATPSGFVAGFGGATTPTSWSTTDKSGVTLSNSNLTSTMIGLGSAAVRTADKLIGGKFYWEYTFTNAANVGSGLANPSAVLTGLLIAGSSSNTGTAFVNSSGAIVVEATVPAVISGFANGNVACIAVDLINNRFWIKNGAAGTWNGSGTANPATNVGGISLNGISSIAVPIHGLMMGNNAGPNGAITGNFGGSTFVGSVPADFTAGFPANYIVPTSAIATMVGEEVWSTGTPAVRATMLGAEIWSPAPTGITFDPNNLNGITLSNFNLTATQTVGVAWVYGTSGQAAGKYYFEYTLGLAPAASDTIGLAAVAVPGVTGASVGANLNVINTTTVSVTVGATTVVSSAAFGTITAMSVGTVIGVAVDFDNQTIWYRVAGGQWNGGVNGNPATNTGGGSFAALSAKGVSFTPRVFLSAGTASGTRIISLNSGDSGPFAGAVPAGFTSGFPKGGPGNTNALFTQVGAEAWRVGASNAQFTQVGAEVWRSVATSVVVTGRARRVVTIST